MVFTGNANPELAQSIAENLGVPMGRANVGRFSDGEVMVEIMENVRGRDVYLVQPTCQPTADNFMELLVMIDALARASAARVTAIIPLLRLRPPGPSPAFVARADHGQGGRPHDQRGWYRPCRHRRSACRPDPGVSSISRSTTSMPRR
jgi:hypothetical protein